MFFSNLRQPAAAEHGQLRPRPTFAVTIGCKSGAKKQGADEWAQLKENLVPVLQSTFFYMIKAARGLLPKPLAATTAYKDDEYHMEEDIVVSSPGDATEEPEDDEEDEEDDEQDDDDGEKDNDADGDEDDDDDDDCG